MGEEPGCPRAPWTSREAVDSVQKQQGGGHCEVRAVPEGLARTGPDQSFRADSVERRCLELACLYTDLGVVVHVALRSFYYFPLLECQLTRTVPDNEMGHEVLVPS